MKIPDRVSNYIPGHSLDFSVEVFSRTPVNFQWNFNNQPISADNSEFEGSETSTLTIKNCQYKHEGPYKCVVSSEEDTTSCETRLRQGMLFNILVIYIF